MANVDAPFGFRPVRHLFGGEVRASEWYIAGGLAANIFRGSVVVPTPGTAKRITIGTAATAPFAGVFDGCQYEDAQGNVVYAHYWPTGQTVKTGTIVRAWVWDDPNILFEVQADGAFTADDIGQDADVTAEVGNALTGMSTQELDSSDIGTGANLHIYDYVRDGVNEVGANARLLVLINEHIHRGVVTEF